jgi:hypothetical protein
MSFLPNKAQGTRSRRTQYPPFKADYCFQIGNATLDPSVPGDDFFAATGNRNEAESLRFSYSIGEREDEVRMGSR